MREHLSNGEGHEHGQLKHSFWMVSFPWLQLSCKRTTIWPFTLFLM